MIRGCDGIEKKNYDQWIANTRPFFVAIPLTGFEYVRFLYLGNSKKLSSCDFTNIHEKLISIYN